MTILVLAPHADDEVLGVGGTIARYSDAGEKIVVAVLTGHGEVKHPFLDKSLWDIVRAESRNAAEILGVSELIFRELPAACLDTHPAWEVNKEVLEVVKEYNPETIFIPFEHDLHKDHASISYAAMVSLRPYLASSRTVRRVLAYETLSETHLAAPYLHASFQPNVFINITDHIDQKVLAMQAYKSQIQADGHPRSASTIRALATLRGSHIGTHAAEAFLLVGEYNR